MRQLKIKNLHPRKPIPEGETLRLELPFPISVNAMFFNLPYRGRAITKEYQSWRTQAGLEIMRQRAGSVPGPVEISITIEEPANSRSDLGNLEKGVTDILVEHGVIDGDHSKVVRRIILEWGEHAGAVVTIRRAQEFTDTR